MESSEATTAQFEYQNLLEKRIERLQRVVAVQQMLQQFNNVQMPDNQV